MRQRPSSNNDASASEKVGGVWRYPDCASEGWGRERKESGYTKRERECEREALKFYLLRARRRGGCKNIHPEEDRSVWGGGKGVFKNRNGPSLSAVL